MLRKILNNLPILFLIAISLILCFQNYTPGTFLSGWDTLHPEFDFGLNFQRLFFGVFRSEQGLGALVAHSHMADLPRVIVLYIFHHFIPLSFLRYSFIFLNLVLGPIGMYFFLQKIVLKNPGLSERSGAVKTASFLGGLFYLLNLGTMQQFIVPFEMFITQYGMLPWIFLFATRYLESKEQTKKNLVIFAVIMLLASPMAYAATLWYMTFLVFVIYVSTFSLIKKDFSVFKKSAILVFLGLVINSFWILPNIYFIISSGGRVVYANINILFSPQAFLYNKEFGNPKDIALIKNFLFDWGAYTVNNHFGSLLQVWIDYLNKPYITLIGFFFTAVAIMGLIYSIVRKNIIGLSFIPVLIFILFFLINDNPPTSFLYKFIQNSIPLFKEAFRFPGDKALGLFIFIFALYFGLGQMKLIGIIKKLPKFSTKFGLILQTLLFTGLLIYYTLPAFKGNLISPLMRVEIPNYYFDVFSYFKSQADTGTIADLPIHSPWGWQYYDWFENKPSYQGAGFIWFGIKQPMLNRDFDRWNPLNEQYYREMSYAVYSKKDELFKKVIEKYNIHYILLDESIIAPENDQIILYVKELKKLLAKLGTENFVKEDAVFGEVKIFKVVHNPDYSYLINGSPKISPRATAYYQDFSYLKYNDYTSENSGGTFYPFGNIINPQSHILNGRLNISQVGATLNFRKERDLVSPELATSEAYVASDLFLEKKANLITIKFYPHLPYENLSNPPLPISAQVNIPDKNFILSINNTSNFTVGNIQENAPLSLGTVFLNTKKDNSISIYPQIPDITVSPDFSNIQFSLSACEDKNSNQVFGLENQENGFTIFGKNAPVCMNIPLGEIFREEELLNNSELLLTSSFIQSGKPLSYVCVADIKKGSCLSYSSKNVNQGNFPENLNYLGIEKNNLKNLSIKILLDATQTANIERVKYSNMVFSLTKPVFSESFSKDFIKESITNASPDPKNKNVLIPFSGNRQLSQDITSLPRTSIYCNPSSPLNHEISKKIVSQEKDNYIQYNSVQGIACDHFSYQNLSQDQGYLLSVTSRNIKGLPLTICVLNYASKHCDLYTNLSKSKEFTTDTFLIPPMQEGQKGYDVDIASLGIRGTGSINDLASIQFIPFPYYFLSQTEEGEKQNASEKNSISIQNEINPSLYTLTLDNPSAGSTLVFSKSYEAGWKAYQVVNGKSSIINSIKLILPFVFGKQLKDHVMINNWANGWTLDESRITNNKSQIIIVFLPQYLEYLGFILTTVFISYLTFKTLKNGRANLTQEQSSDKLKTSDISPQNADQAAPMTK